MRFMAFIAPTRKRRVKGRASPPSGSGSPKGLATASMRSPPAQTSAAAANWAASFTLGDMPRTSSTAPTATTKMPESAMVTRRCPWIAGPVAAARAMPPRKAAAMASPPMRGTAVAWDFRAVSGWSRAPTRRARWPARGVSASARAKEAASAMVEANMPP
jgi:hypothetical protein